jgi:hypothetical protein
MILGPELEAARRESRRGFPRRMGVPDTPERAAGVL